MRIYLADLGHNQITKTSDSYPLGVANLAAYLLEYLRAHTRPEVAIFREPEDLKRALDAAAPDVLGLSSYAWNHQLSRSFARYAKRRVPATITMMGGPNFPLVASEQERFLRDMPEIDVAVRGPVAEGERAFLNVVQRLVDTGGRLEGLHEESVPGNMWIVPGRGEFVAGALVPRIENLDEIPSPYLRGLLDPFWATGYYPLMQVARGCPFECQFCNSSPASNNRVYAHSLENVKADLMYAAARVDRTVALSFADDNFGMYERDVELADFIGWLQDTHDWPRYIRTTTGKNRGDRIIEVMRRTRRALPMTSAVQSMDPVVLRNIKRSNIKLETYARIQQETRAQGMQSYGELILSMPGETKQSHLNGIRDLMDAGVLRVSANQLLLEHGAPLSNPDQRQRFAFRTHFRVVPRNLGDYGTGERVIETEEMVAETDTLSFAEYLEVRVLHLLLSIFFYEGNFAEAFRWASEQGLKPFDVIERAQRMVDEAPAPFVGVINDFVRETRGELFDSHDAAVAWARDRFAEIVAGEVGGNLLSKYSLTARFFMTRETLSFLERVLASALDDGLTGPGREELAAVIGYLDAVLLRSPFRETMEQTDTFTSTYDVEAWRATRDGRPLSSFRVPTPITWMVEMDPATRAVFQHRLDTFGDRPATMGKFTRTMVGGDLRRTLTRRVDPGGPSR